MRSNAESIFLAGVAAVEPLEAVLRTLRLRGEVLEIGGDRIDLDEIRSVWILGAGKAARGMAAGAVELLAHRVSGGSIAVPDGLGRRLDPLDVWEAGHPVPDARGLAAAAEALRLARAAREDDLVICLLSGGASALWSAPAGEVTLGDLQQTTSRLLAAGAPIQEINAVRRHLSRIAGGRLAAAAAPARVLTLAISDVVGGGPHDIGSGPTCPDPTGYQEAMRVVMDHGAGVPAVLRHLQAGAAGDLGPAPSSPRREPPSFHVIGSVREALAAAAEEAVRLGYTATVVSDRLAGPATVAAAEIARTALEARSVGGGPHALLWGGETTVIVRGGGQGGRNQELALAAASAIAGVDDVVIASIATDGIDGPTRAAGAIVDGSTLERGRAAGIDPDHALLDNDSHTFLRATGDLVLTGPSGTNVNDLVIALVG